MIWCYRRTAGRRDGRASSGDERGSPARTEQLPSLPITATRPVRYPTARRAYVGPLSSPARTHHVPPRRATPPRPSVRRVIPRPAFSSHRKAAGACRHSLPVPQTSLKPHVARQARSSSASSLSLSPSRPRSPSADPAPACLQPSANVPARRAPATSTNLADSPSRARTRRSTRLRIPIPSPPTSPSSTRPIAVHHPPRPARRAP